MTTPTRDIDESAPRIGGKRELVERLAGGSKPKSQWRIGTEHEKFGFIESTLRPVPYEGEASIRALLEGLAVGPAAILIGPEGGFSPAERARLRALTYVRPVGLGPRILRAETAAVATLSLWQAVRGDWRR